MKEVTFLERVIVMDAFSDVISCLWRPSTMTSISFGLIALIVSLVSAGKTMERSTESEQIGVRTNPSIAMSSTGPPAESE